MNLYRYVGVSLLLFLGCSKAPALKIYTFDTPEVKSIKYSIYKNKNLKITYPRSLKEPISAKMHFSYSYADRGVYQNAQWNNNISQLLQGTLIEILSESKLFKAVLFDTSTADEDYRLESTIFAFEHRVRGEHSSSVVSIQFTLIDTDRGKLVKSRRFIYQEPTPTIDAEGYAKATNTIMRRLSRDLVEWLR